MFFALPGTALSSYLQTAHTYLIPEQLGCVFLGKSEKRIIDPRCIKATDESTLGKDSSVPLMQRDPSDLGSMIRFRVFPKKTHP